MTVPQPPTELPRRPRARWLVGAFLLGVALGAAVVGVFWWNRTTPAGGGGSPTTPVVKGQLLPVEVAQIYPPRTGVVREIRVKPGQEIGPGYEVVSLFSSELEEQYGKAQGDFRAATVAIQLNRRVLADPTLLPAEKVNHQLNQVLAENQRDHASAQMEAMDKAYNYGQPQPANKIGYFRALAPPLDPKLARPPGPSVWTVLGEDPREKLLGRTVRPDQELIRVGNLSGPWHVELKIPQRHVVQVRRAFADPEYHKVEAGTGWAYLDVDVLLAGQADAGYLGRMYREDVSAQVLPDKNEHDETEPVAIAYVKLNLDRDDFPAERKIPTGLLVAGLGVHARIRCGDENR